MTNSRSKASRSKLLALLVVVLCAGTAWAGGRKRVVVLELEGPKSDKFHDDLEKLIRKNHTVVPTEKWNSTAENLDASSLTDKDVKKVAKKLHVDAIVTGRIEKRRDEFILRLRLRAGKTGEQVGSMIDTKADGPKIDGKAQKDLNDELIDQISSIESNRSGGGATDDEEDDKPIAKKGKPADDEEDKPVAKKGGKKVAEVDDEDKPVAKKGGKKATDDEDDKPVAKKGGKKTTDDEADDKPIAKKGGKKPADDEDTDKPAGKKGFSKKAKGGVEDEDADPKGKKGSAKKATLDEEDDTKPTAKKGKIEPAVAKKQAKTEDDPPPKKKIDDEDEDKKPTTKKKVASNEDEEGVEKDGGDEPSLGADAALSPSQRALDGVAGLSITARRLSFNTRADLANKPPGYKGTPVAGAMLDVMFYPLAMGHTRKDYLKDIGVFVMYDRVLSIDTKDAMGTHYATSESRYGFGAAFRYAFDKSSPMSMVIGGTLGYSSQTFSISPNGATIPDIPSVSYTILEPGGFFRYPVNDKIVLNADAKFMLITDTGPIQGAMQYGAATVLGFEGSFGGDYAITKNIFARATFRIETIGLSFQGKGAMTSMRDGDPNSIDVGGARDTYFGGTATVGYLY